MMIKIGAGGGDDANDENLSGGDDEDGDDGVSLTGPG